MSTGLVRLVPRATLGAISLVTVAAAVALPAGPSDPPARHRVAASGASLVHVNSRDGEAILSANGLAPGDAHTGDVTITNRGPGARFYLKARPAADSFSQRLQATIVETADRRAIATGSLSDIRGCVGLGEFAPGESRRFNFTVSFPEGGAEDNHYGGASTTASYEWISADRVDEACDAFVSTPLMPSQPTPAAEASGAVAVRVGGIRLEIEPGPYRFSRRSGTARLGVRCIESYSSACRGRIDLLRRKTGQGRGIAMAAGTFQIPSGQRRSITVRLNRRARKRISATKAVPVSAYVTARDARGRKRRAGYRDRLIYTRR